MKKFKHWDEMSVEEQIEVSDKFFKERDIYPYSDDGKPVKAFWNWLKEEGYFKNNPFLYGKKKRLKKMRKVS